MLIIIQESIKNRTNLVYQKSNEVNWVVLSIQHICNTATNKSLISGLFSFSKRYQRDNYICYIYRNAADILCGVFVAPSKTYCFRGVFVH